MKDAVLLYRIVIVLLLSLSPPCTPTVTLQKGLEGCILHFGCLTGITVISRNFCIIKSFNFSLFNGYRCLKLWYMLLGTCSCVFGSLYITMSTPEQASRAFEARSHEPFVEQLQQRSEGEWCIHKVRSVLNCCSPALLINCLPWLKTLVQNLLVCRYL